MGRDASAWNVFRTEHISGRGFMAARRDFRIVAAFHEPTMLSQGFKAV
jgi:hypothetical protein